MGIEVTYLNLVKAIYDKVKESESEHPCFVPDLRGNVFSFSPWRIMLSVGLLYMAFTPLR